MNGQDWAVLLGLWAISRFWTGGVPKPRTVKEAETIVPAKALVLGTLAGAYLLVRFREQPTTAATAGGTN